ncbi:hypothetical protein [Limnoglobus roseus]|uniref:hypothetical protein n=1 Tax=Limnoglobus roseus TaxID=2598579 RepID=UPI0011EB16BC|nr:hypothetical protein [Limnoglobus roseus]
MSEIRYTRIVNGRRVEFIGRSAGPPVDPAQLIPLPAARPPCLYEGPVVEYCTGCAGEGRHVRLCDLAGADRDTCTRARVGPAVQACADCPDWRPQEAPLPPFPPPPPPMSAHSLTIIPWPP